MTNTCTINAYLLLAAFLCIMTKDRRYITAKNLISGGYVKTFSDLLDTIPKTRLAIDMGTSPARLNALIDNPELFVLKDIIKISELIGVEVPDIFKLIYQDYINKKSRKKR